MQRSELDAGDPCGSRGDAARSPVSRRRHLLVLGRHQLAAFVATVVDFATMVIAVEVGHATPVGGTAAGATFGAIVNFTINRHWTFSAAHRGVTPQALRYVIVAGTSLGLQVAGVWLFTHVVRLHYVLARVISSVLTSLLWNFPMQRWFVFHT